MPLTAGVILANSINYFVYVLTNSIYYFVYASTNVQAVSQKAWQKTKSISLEQSSNKKIQTMQ